MFHPDEVLTDCLPAVPPALDWLMVVEDLFVLVILGLCLAIFVYPPLIGLPRPMEARETRGTHRRPSDD